MFLPPLVPPPLALNPINFSGGWTQIRSSLLMPTQNWFLANSVVGMSIGPNNIPPTTGYLTGYAAYLAGVEIGGIRGYDTVGARMNALQLWLPSWYQATVPPPLSSGDSFTDFVNFYSGVMDAVTLGAMGYLRQQTGLSQYVDMNSTWYGFGQVAGSLIVSIAAWELAGMSSLGQAGTALRWAMVGEGVISGAEQIAEGNIAAGVLSIGMSVLGASAICGVGLCSLLGQTAARAVIGATAVSGAVVGVQGASQMYNGSYVTGFSNFLMGAAALLAVSQTQACFVAGTPIRTPEGWKAIEELKVGEWVLSRSDKDAEGEVRARRVVQTFLRYADVVDVLVRGKMIGTTAEHPFYVQGSRLAGGGRTERRRSAARRGGVGNMWRNEGDGEAGEGVQCAG